MRNALPKSGPRIHESAVINLDDFRGSGTHWVAYIKNENDVIYFDPFGNLRPPLELIDYLDVGSIKYNYEQYQNFNTYICGHLCLKFLTNTLYKESKSAFVISCE